MKIQFDSTLSHQKSGIDAIVDIFQGQEKCEANFTVYSPEYLAAQKQLALNDIGYGNRLTLTEGKIVENVQRIQLMHGLAPSTRQQVDRNNLDFTIEMETGTGKTYVYLRTMMELYRRYGFSKHIIVVPSISIREGVYKSLQMTEEHFKELYDNIPYNYFIYDNRNNNNLSKVRDFATNVGIEIMIINIQAFRQSFENPGDIKKKANIIHRYNDTLGYKPLDLIKNTNPIVFIDEPQTTMKSPLAKKAVQNLSPLAMIRYSATHREKVNLMYKLDARDAYEKKLVKQIEVGALKVEGANNQAYIKLKDVKISKRAPQARVEVDILKNGKITRKVITVKKNADLEELTNRDVYEGYIINDIHGEKGNEYIDFTSQSGFIKKGEVIGAVDDKQVKTDMIRKTIEEHLEKELKLNKQGIKVLSLFFIDTVSKYRQYDEEGNEIIGEYAEIFERAYTELVRKPKYQNLFAEVKKEDMEASLVHNGYFSIDKKSKASNKKEKYEFYKDTTGNTKADEDTYQLIMRDKEKLLSFDSKLRFIFSHSTLKEGWDNPNVFQICTLKESGNSDIQRRQEIGRGLRLCVNQDGNRVHGHEVNTLTVMATESYEQFVENLQKEMEKETGIRFGFLETHSFSNVVKEMQGDEPVYLGQEESETLYDFLIVKGYIDTRGKVLDLLRIDLKEEKVVLPEAIEADEVLLNQVLNRLRSAAGKLEIKNKDDKKSIKVRRKVLDSPEFAALWERVKYKTYFSVDFDSDKLIQACIHSIDDRLSVSRGKLYYTKVGIAMTIGGVEGEVKDTSVSTIKDEVDVLPDIVGYLQNETQLTRKSIVKILTGTPKLKLFKRNPQKFIEGCIDIINEQMRLHIVDGIKYHKTGDAEYYSQELFDNEELFGYLKNNLKESSKSPYEYVVFDSGVESKLVEEFENSKNIEVYAKLPGWFKIDTPLGTYNPDWAILWKDDNGTEEKLYFVVESKDTLGQAALRGTESAKITCGKAHFKAIGAEMVVAKVMEDVEDYALGGSGT